MSGGRSKESRPSPIPLSKDSIKKLLPYIPYILIGYLTDRLSWLYRHARGNPTHKLITVLTHPELDFKTPLPSINAVDILIGIIQILSDS